MSERLYPEDDPERVFMEWMVSNMRDLRGAAEALGVTVEDGADFAKRLKAAVLPKLLERNS